MMWDVVTVIAAILMAYGTWEIIEAKGWGLGFPMALLAAIAGYVSFEMVYPLWTGRK
jgi:hypothetical protein